MTEREREVIRTTLYNIEFFSKEHRLAGSVYKDELMELLVAEKLGIKLTKEQGESVKEGIELVVSDVQRQKRLAIGAEKAAEEEKIESAGALTVIEGLEVKMSKAYTH